jgi:hypothetical protein
MDKTKIGLGIFSVAMAVVAGVNLSKEFEPKTASEGDKTAAVIANVAPSSPVKHCSKAWAQVNADPEPVLGWQCDGAWMPADSQRELDKSLGEDAVAAEFTARDVDGGVVLDAAVTKGEAPAKPPVFEVTGPEGNITLESQGVGVKEP